MIICIGNALVDSLEQIEEFVIDELNLNKARMTLVDKERSNFLLQNMENPIYEAGGSAANTAYWISQLGGEVGFIGKISNDKLGNQFQSSLKESGLKDFTVFRNFLKFLIDFLIGFPDKISSEFLRISSALIVKSPKFPMGVETR